MLTGSGRGQLLSIQSDFPSTHATLAAETQQPPVPVETVVQYTDSLPGERGTTSWFTLLISSISMTTESTCLRCRRDLNFGPGNSCSFESSHKKLSPSSPPDWCCCLDAPPSAPPQQLISSSCSFGDINQQSDEVYS